MRDTIAGRPIGSILRFINYKVHDWNPTQMKVTFKGLKFHLIKLYRFSAIWVVSNFALVKRKTLGKQPIVTIFGSCRQDAIYSHFRVTKIRNGLTYPHYTKEVIQAINFCKGSKDSKTLPVWAFRNSLIGVPILSQRKLQREFKRTEIFVIEIASLIEYKYGNFFVHHEFHDSSNSISKFSDSSWPGKESIELRAQPIDELISDLDEIVELLGKDRIVFVTHISTRETGMRALLIKSIVNYCEEKEIPFFNPSALLEFYPVNEIAEEEDVLSHFKPFGHALVGFRLREAIEEVYSKQNLKQKYLIQRIEKPTLGKEGFNSGFGDYLIGSSKVYEMARKFNLFPAVDFSNSNFIHFYIGKAFDVSEHEVKKIFHEDSDLQFLRTSLCFTNKRPCREFDTEARDFILRNCLKKTDAFSHFVQEKMADLSISNKDYVVLHLRVDDTFDQAFDPQVLQTILKVALRVVSLEDRDVIAMSNSNIVREKLKNSGIKVPDALPVHSADPSVSVDDLRSTVLEFEIMGKSKMIYSGSTYSWGSGFSSIASSVFNVPLKILDLNNAQN